MVYLVLIENGSLSPDRSTHLVASSAKGIFAREGSAAIAVLSNAAELERAHWETKAMILEGTSADTFNRRCVVDEARAYADEELLRGLRILQGANS